MGIFKKTLSATAVAHELARVALDIKPEQAVTITEVAAEVSIPADKVRREYVYFLVYMVETAAQNATSDRETGEYLLSRYREAVTNLAGDKGYGGDFWHEQAKRTPIYDEVWQDVRGVGTEAAMTTALADQIGAPDIIPIGLLSIYGMHLLAPLSKYLRGKRIVRP